jgi:predicted nucleic acid-binding protein
MNVVDSSGWLEYSADGPNASFFAPAIENLPDLVVPSISIYEVFKRVLLQRGENDALQVATAMQQGTVVDLDADIAVRAAMLSVHVGLPMADSIMLATAEMHSATLWTQDAHFRTMAGVKYVEKL